MKRYDLDTLITNFKNKDKIALARLITLIENEPERAHEVFKHFENTKNESYILGITGSPGVGKSTLTGAITQKLLDQGKSVGIICVDPTSPFSGGAFLGDRVRMTNISLHPKIFMRSLASRGYKGGISRAVFDISLLYEAYGMDVIIIETVGVGQAEFDIYNLAYTVVVVLVPGYGDAIQMQKAGIIEIGDVYDVNKKDLEGIEELIQNIWDHKEHLELSEELTQKKINRFRYKIKELVSSKIERLVTESFMNDQEISEIVEHAIRDGKFKIYETIHNKFEEIYFEIKKKE